MTNISRLALVLAISCFCPLNSTGQSTIAASGGNVDGSEGYISYTAGQILCKAYFSIDGKVSLGVQQPFEVFCLTEVKNMKEITIQFNIYPNPTKESLILDTAPFGHEQMRLTLFDLKGIHLLSKKTEGEKTMISFENLPPAIYFLRVEYGYQEVKVFKIIKN